jgi:hypothetical protein
MSIIGIGTEGTCTLLDAVIGLVMDRHKSVVHIWLT